MVVIDQFIAAYSQWNLIITIPHRILWFLNPSITGLTQIEQKGTYWS